MRPGPRVQASIDLLNLVVAGDDAADRIVAAYFRRRRYAGSKDRAAVTELVYSVLRRRAWLEWRLSNAGAGGQGARRMVIAQLVDGGVPENEIAALFDGSEHAPPPLSLEEAAIAQLLQRPPSGTPPPSVAGNYPGWLQGALEQRFGMNLAAEMAALNERAPLDIRVNTARIDRASVLSSLRENGFEAEPTPYARSGIRLAEGRRIDTNPLYREGLIEIQDEGSQIAVALIDAHSGERIIDYCAGAGGKALALAATMGDHGEIIACDRSSARLRNIAPRVARAGAKTIHPRSVEEACAQGKADRVLLDVPCSGTGAWRRRPETRWLLSEDKLHEYNNLQDELLVEGSKLTSKNGTLIYTTCSVLESEGEDRIEAFLGRVPDFEVVDVDRLWPNVLDGERPDRGPFVNLSPATCGTDGFFVAVLRNTA
jgi:16S rRNA (cytosine967-C5)-methyltransferase